MKVKGIVVAVIIGLIVATATWASAKRESTSTDAASVVLYGNNGTAIIPLKTSSDGSLALGNITPPLTIGNATSGLYVGANGNVGIGTTLPGRKLHVQGSIAEYVLFNGMNNKGIMLQDANNVASILGYNSSGFNNIEIRATTGSGTGIFLPSSGNVGIATTAPSAKLHVSGNATIAGSTDVPQLIVQSAAVQTQPIFEVRNDTGVGKVTILANGNVGIGTTAPGNALQVTGNVRTNGAVYFDGGEYIRDQAEGLTFETNSTKRITIGATSGNVGISTTAPSATLSLKAADSTPASGLFIGGAAGGAITFIGAGTDACYKLYITSTGTVATNVVTCPTAL